MSPNTCTAPVIPRSSVRVGRRGICRLAALLLPAFLTLAPATASSASQKPPEFPTRAEIVTVDVVVLDRDGKPVPGLTRADFMVREDGRPQTVSAFEVVEALLPTVTAPETVTSTTSLSRIATNVAEPPTRRAFAIVFDDMHVGDVNIEEAKRAVETFVARDTAPGDRIVLVTVSDGRYWATTRGAEDAAWRDALKGVRSHRLLQGRPECRPTYYEAMQADPFGNARVAGMFQRRWLALCAPPTMRPSPEELLGGASARRGPPLTAASSLMPSMREEYARHRGQLLGSLRVVREIVSRLGATRAASPSSW